MGITAPTTASDDQNRARRLPPDLLHRTNTLLDELERLRAEVQRLTPDHAHARKCRTNAIESLVLLALDNATLIVDMLDVSRCRRTKKVREHLRAHPERYGDKVPSHDSVRKVLIKHGYV